MFKKIKEMWSDWLPPNPSFGDKCFGIAMAGLIFFGIVGFVTYVVVTVVDTAGIKPTKTVKAMVSAKEIIHHEGGATITWIEGVMYQLHHPDSDTHHVYCIEDEEKHDVVVEKELYETINVGDAVEIDYAQGRLSGSRIPVKYRFMGNQ